MTEKALTQKELDKLLAGEKPPEESRYPPTPLPHGHKDWYQVPVLEVEEKEAAVSLDEPVTAGR